MDSIHGELGLPDAHYQRGSGAPTCVMMNRCLCEAGFPSLLTLSLQLAKFSEDTLSSYTEAVSSQVKC